MPFLFAAEPIDKERRGLPAFQQTGEPFDVIGRGHHAHNRCEGMDELASKEAKRGQRLDEEDGGCREAAIGEKAGKTIQEREIARL